MVTLLERDILLHRNSYISIGTVFGKESSVLLSIVIPWYTQFCGLCCTQIWDFLHRSSIFASWQHCIFLLVVKQDGGSGRCRISKKKNSGFRRISITICWNRVIKYRSYCVKSFLGQKCYQNLFLIVILSTWDIDFLLFFSYFSISSENYWSYI